MNRNVIVSIPRGSNVRKYIRDKYTELYRAWRRANPTSISYTLRKLRQNISQALSIHGKTFKEEAFRQTDYAPWSNGIFIEYYHWYYLVNIFTDKRGNLIGQVTDARYEGDYHNDTMTTKPYESKIYKNKQSKRLTEAQFKRMLTECITKIINEIA